MLHHCHLNQKKKKKSPLEPDWYFNCSIMTNPRGWLVLNYFVLSVHMLIASQILLPHLPNLNWLLPVSLLMWEEKFIWPMFKGHTLWTTDVFLIFPCHWKNEGKGKLLLSLNIVLVSMIKSLLFVQGPCSSPARKEGLAGNDFAHAEYFERNKYFYSLWSDSSS